MNLVPDSMEQMLDDLGLDLGKSTEKEVWAICPGHDDHNPTSFSVNRETGAYYCFACGYRGDALVTLVIDVLKLDVWSATMWMRDHGASLGTRIEQIKRKRAPGPTSKRAPSESGYSLEGEFAVFGPVPKKVLAKRSISPEAADHFDLRWDGDHYLIPIYDREGDLQGWQKRKKPRPLNYPRGLKKSNFLFGHDVFRGKRAILVESPLDAVRLWDIGFEGAVSSFGARVSKVQMNIIIDLADRLLLALDDDEAGWEMTEKLVSIYARRLPVHVFNYEQASGKDPGDLTDDEIFRGMSTAEFAGIPLRPARAR